MSSKSPEEIRQRMNAMSEASMKLREAMRRQQHDAVVLAKKNEIYIEAIRDAVDSGYDQAGHLAQALLEAELIR